MDSYVKKEITIIVGFSVLTVFIAGFFIPYMVANAYDMPEMIDTGGEAASRSIEPQIYRFAEFQIENATYSNGNIYPTVTSELQKYNHTSGQWETIGYSNTHLHNVKVDETDVVDVSIGHTDRINIKH